MKVQSKATFGQCSTVCAHLSTYTELELTSQPLDEDEGGLQRGTD